MLNIITISWVAFLTFNHVFKIIKAPPEPGSNKAKTIAIFIVISLNLLVGYNILT